jgi:hypothetical protein
MVYYIFAIAQTNNTEIRVLTTFFNFFLANMLTHFLLPPSSVRLGLCTELIHSYNEKFCRQERKKIASSMARFIKFKVLFALFHLRSLSPWSGTRTLWTIQAPS